MEGCWKPKQSLKRDCTQTHSLTGMLEIYKARLSCVALG